MINQVVETLKEPPQTIFIQSVQDVELFAELNEFAKSMKMKQEDLRMMLLTDGKSVNIIGFSLDKKEKNVMPHIQAKI